LEGKKEAGSGWFHQHAVLPVPSTGTMLITGEEVMNMVISCCLGVKFREQKLSKMYVYVGVGKEIQREAAQAYKSFANLLKL